MTSILTVRIGGAMIGSLAMIGAGVLVGDVWLFAAAAGVMAVIGTIFDHQLGLAQVLACLALVIGLATADVLWFIPILVAGTIASFELAAAADRTSAIRPSMTFRSIGPAVIGAGLASGVVLTIGEVTRGGPTYAVIGAAVAAVVALRLLAR